MEKIMLIFLALNFQFHFHSPHLAHGQANTKKYCFTTSVGKYEIALSEDENKKCIYKLYNPYGELQKTMQGTWVIRDEGVYGPAYMLTISWTGLNVNMPALKFVCQYDGDGKLQGIIDSQSRTWNKCN